ncbi:hypothetical protein PR048_014196 [Dryococelus australis]|uniref:Uncharacterized protein n=1 Tax=Dryococelus australis TaxID=614101 RepID=A0ABQ9HDM3_9NEOP|nr:hypothetical protein PR048_014196 [Dryococelus australis]
MKPGDVKKPFQCNTILPVDLHGVERQLTERRVMGSHPGLTLGWVPSMRAFLGEFPFTPPLHSGADPYSPRLTLIGSQDLGVKRRPNLCTPLLRLTLHALSRTVGFTRRFHTLSSIHARNTSLTVIPQSPVVVHTSFRSRTLGQVASVKDCRLLGCVTQNLPEHASCAEEARYTSQSHQNILASSPDPSKPPAGRRAVTQARRQQHDSPTAAVHYSRVSQKGLSGGNLGRRGVVRWVHRHSARQQRVCLSRREEGRAYLKAEAGLQPGNLSLVTAAASKASSVSCSHAHPAFARSSEPSTTRYFTSSHQLFHYVHRNWGAYYRVSDSRQVFPHCITAAIAVEIRHFPRSFRVRKGSEMMLVESLLRAGLVNPRIFFPAPCYSSAARRLVKENKPRVCVCVRAPADLSDCGYDTAGRQRRDSTQHGASGEIPHNAAPAGRFTQRGASGEIPHIAAPAGRFTQRGASGEIPHIAAPAERFHTTRCQRGDSTHSGASGEIPHIAAPAGRFTQRGASGEIPHIAAPAGRFTQRGASGEIPHNAAPAGRFTQRGASGEIPHIAAPVGERSRSLCSAVHGYATRRYFFSVANRRPFYYVLYLYPLTYPCDLTFKVSLCVAARRNTSFFCVASARCIVGAGSGVSRNANEAAEKHVDPRGKTVCSGVRVARCGLYVRRGCLSLAAPQTKDEVDRLFVFCACRLPSIDLLPSYTTAKVTRSTVMNVLVALAEKQFNVGTRRLVVRSQRDRFTSSLVYDWLTTLGALQGGDSSCRRRVSDTPMSTGTEDCRQVISRIADMMTERRGQIRGVLVFPPENCCFWSDCDPVSRREDVRPPKLRDCGPEAIVLVGTLAHAVSWTRYTDAGEHATYCSMWLSMAGHVHLNSLLLARKTPRPDLHWPISGALFNIFDPGYKLVEGVTATRFARGAASGKENGAVSKEVKCDGIKPFTVYTSFLSALRAAPLYAHPLLYIGLIPSPFTSFLTALRAAPLYAHPLLYIGLIPSPFTSFLTALRAAPLYAHPLLYIGLIPSPFTSLLTALRAAPLYAHPLLYIGLIPSPFISLLTTSLSSMLTAPL